MKSITLGNGMRNKHSGVQIGIGIAVDIGFEGFRIAEPLPCFIWIEDR